MERTIFNRNHITITVREMNQTDGKWRVYWNSGYEIIKPKGMEMTAIEERFEDIIKESPLGFYYKSMHKVKYKETVQMTAKIIYHIVTFNLYDTFYRVQYPISCNDVNIGFDSRPWDICNGDLSMHENLIKVLQKILNEIFESAAPIKGIARTKEKVFIEIFGNSKGYNTLDNEIKILSHGFDPKESFRKMKRKK